MYNILRLVRVQIGTVLVDMLSIGNSRKKKPKALYTGLALFVLLFGAMSFFYNYMIGKGLMMYDSIEVLPAMMMAITSVIVLLTTVFKVKGTIFGFKDYDMVMSLPVSAGGIVASRLLLLYSINMLFVCIVMIPMMVAYGILANPNILFYIMGFVGLLLLPLIPIIIASIFGTIIAYAASKFRYSNFVSIIVSFVFFLAIMGSSFMMGDTGEELVDLSKALTNQVNAIYPLAEMYSNAICNFDLVSFLSFIGISLLGFMIYALFVGKIFKKVNTLIMTGRYKANFKMKALKQTSPLKALYNKEMRRYFSSTLYVMNTGIGIVMLTIGAIALFFIDIDKMLGDPQAAIMLKSGGGVLIGFCIATCSTTMASISLEGKNLWIVKSLPVEAKTVFLSKIALNLVIIAPAFIDAVLIGILLKSSSLLIVFSVLIVAVFGLFMALLGLVVNLRFPNFNWKTETVVIKQSAAAMIAIFSGIGVVGLLVILLFLMPTTNVAYTLFIGIMIIANIVLYRVLTTWGSKQFEKL